MCFTTEIDKYGQNGYKTTFMRKFTFLFLFARDLTCIFFVAVLLYTVVNLNCWFKFSGFDLLTKVIIKTDEIILTPKILNSYLAVALFGCLIVFLKYRNMTFSESLLIAPSTGICLKRVNYLGQQSSRFFQMTQIKTIVIMEGFTKQSVICFLALVLRDTDTVIPLFKSFQPKTVVLQEIHKQTSMLLNKSDNNG